MKKLYFIATILTFVSFISVIHAQAPTYLWARTSGGSATDYGRSVAVDTSGNSYVTGYFGSTSITFGSTTLTNAGLLDIYIIKYDPAGNVVWAKSAGGTSNDYGYDIAVDEVGNVYITGSFDSPSLTFGSTTLSNLNIYNEMFVAKYDASGNVLWANTATGSSHEYGLGIDTDSNGNCYVTGYFKSPTLTLNGISLTNVGNPAFLRDETFLAKYDAGGAIVWAKSGEGTGFDQGTAIDVDDNGNSYLTGWFSDPGIFFGSTYLTTTAGASIFLVKYDTGGNVVWAKKAGGVSIDYAYGIATDALGNSFVAGTFRSPVLTFGSSTLTNAGFDDMFVMKFDASGNPVWARSAGDTYYEKALTIATDAIGNCYVGGYYAGSSITFGSTTFSNTTGIRKPFLVKYNTGGSVVWAKSSSGVNDDIQTELGVAADLSGQTYITGAFRGSTITFGSFILNNSLPGIYKLFLAKVDSIANAIQPVAAFTANTTTIAVAGNVNFTDLSTNAPTQWNWTFVGGSPATSSTQNPTNIVYNTAGCYTVSLIATNSTGSDTVTQTCYINVGNTSFNCNELFFSEYLEGSSNNKALEIYNPTSSAINLSNYAIELYNNGSPTVSSTYNLSGNIAAYDVFVIANPASTAPILAVANITNAICQFNGNDALALSKNGTILDVIGEIGINPGTSWTVGSGSTLDHTLVRNVIVDGPQTSWLIAQNEWTSYPNNTINYIGINSSACDPTGMEITNAENSLISVMPNPFYNTISIRSNHDLNGKYYKITNSFGIEIKSGILSEKEFIINMENFTKGVYFLQLGDPVQNFKLIKQ